MQWTGQDRGVGQQVSWVYGGSHFTALVSLIVTKGFAWVPQDCWLSFSRVHGRCKKYDHSLLSPLSPDAASFLPAPQAATPSRMVYMCGMEPTGEPGAGESKRALS